jgi:hypothetical protein
LCDVGHSLQDLLPFIRNASVQYEPCDLSINICKVPYSESDIAKSKNVVSRGRNDSDISILGITELVWLLVAGLHINLNDYKSIKVAINRVFSQNRDHMIVVVFVIG